MKIVCNNWSVIIIVGFLLHGLGRAPVSAADSPWLAAAPVVRMEARELFSLVPGTPADLVFIPQKTGVSGNDRAEPAVVFEGGGTICLPFAPRYAGRLRLRIGYLRGAEYSAFTVTLNDKKIIQENSSESALCRAEQTVDTEALAADGNLLTFRTARPGRVALRFVQWQPLDRLVLPAGVWAEPSPAAAGEPHLWRTFVFHPDPARQVQLNLPDADDRQTLRLNGEAVPLRPLADGAGRFAVLAPERWLPGINTLTLTRPEAQAPRAELTTAGDLCALASLPPELTPASAAAFPHQTLANRHLQAEVALPDLRAGFYRGNRFEAAGMVYSLRYRDTELFRGIAPARNPLRSEDGMGNAEEFSEPAGYEEAAVGEPFLKIGVGRLQKALWSKYNFGLPAFPVELFPWTFAQEGAALVFTQQGKHRDYAYRYVKRVALVPDAPVLRVDYELTNTGTRPLRTSHYSHNFLRFAETAPGPDYALRYNQPVRPQFNRYPSSAVAFANGGLTFAPVDSVFFGRLLPLPGGAVADAAELTCPALGIGLRLRNEGLPVYRLRLFVEKRILSPEFFVRLDLAPGETARWSRTWEAFALAR